MCGILIYTSQLSVRFLQTMCTNTIECLDEVATREIHRVCVACFGSNDPRLWNENVTCDNSCLAGNCRCYIDEKTSRELSFSQYQEGEAHEWDVITFIYNE